MKLVEEEESRLRRKLERELGPTILEALQDPSVVEICVNNDGRVRVERLQKGFDVTSERLEPARVHGLLTTIATLQGVVLNASVPVLESWIPGDGSRIEGVIPPIARAPVFTIRKHATKVYSLADYVHADRMSPSVRDALRAAIAAHHSILVVGGTGSGKTTLVNALLFEVNEQSPNARLIILEDTRELVPPSEACQPYETSREVDMEGLLRVSLRSRPDRIIVGEVRGREVLALLLAMNTGHTGGIATVHANSARAGLMRIEQLATLAQGFPIQRSEIAQAIQVVVYVERGPRGPRVRNVIRINGCVADGYELEDLAS